MNQIDFRTNYCISYSPRKLKHIIINDTLYMLKFLNNGIASTCYKILNMKNKVLMVSLKYDFQTKYKREIFLQPRKKHIPHYTFIGMMEDKRKDRYYIDICEQYYPINKHNTLYKAIYRFGTYPTTFNEFIDIFKQNHPNEKSLIKAFIYLDSEINRILKTTHRKKKKHYWDIHHNNIMVDSKENIILLDLFC